MVISWCSWLNWNIIPICSSNNIVSPQIVFIPDSSCQQKEILPAIQRHPQDSQKSSLSFVLFPFRSSSKYKEEHQIIEHIEKCNNNFATRKISTKVQHFGISIDFERSLNISWKYMRIIYSENKCLEIWQNMCLKLPQSIRGQIDISTCSIGSRSCCCWGQHKHHSL